ncbi:MAG: MotA/TolQ/ExbB proton channel family protein [Verrucomicrobia bacterium]|nr:MotA/TolQ/ExbB proton channel family protein [Verrucomicrobiota bacterium]
MNTMLFFLPMFPQADLVDAFLRANTAGKALVVLLLIGSVVAWSIMVTKFREYRRAYRESKRFLAVYQGEPYPLALILKRQSFPGCPLYMMYRAACRTLHGLIEVRGINPAEWFGGQPTESTPKLDDTDMKIVRNIIDQTVDEQVIQIEKNVVVLATAVTAAPFIGLMGTVWGVMDAFGGLAIQGMATISSVAPGISGSLITTLAGLIVALPSLIAYNMLTSRIRILSTMMEHFAEELMADIERHSLRK